MSSSIKNLNQVLAFQLEGIHDLIKTLQADLSKVTKSISDEEMRMAFNAYRNNIDDQRLKLKRIFGYLLSGPYKRKGIQGFSQWSDITDKDMLARLRDVVMGTSLELTIRYLINAYTEARYIAMRLELDTVVQIIDQIIDVEEEFSKKLKHLSSTQINQACLLAPIN